MFLSTNNCEGLGDCVKQCPTEAIRLINGRAFSCITCGACYRACPNHAIYKNKYGGYGVDRAKCNGCGVCKFNCPINNIKIDEDGVVKGICARCGVCTDICPNNNRVDGFDLIKDKQINYLKSLDAALPRYETHTHSNTESKTRLCVNTNLDDCILCGRCEYYCPTNAIRLTVDKARGLCNQCNICADVCPTQSIKNGIVNYDTCSLCLNCLKNCPNDAIILDDFKISVNKLQQENNGSIISCLNCGLCEDMSETDSLVIVDGKLRYDISKDFDTLNNFNKSIEYCPVSTLHINSNGIVINNIEKDSYLEGYCTLCSNCVSVCEQNARVYDFVKWDGKANDTCINCGTCVEVCPEDAIILKKEGIEVNLDDCILCERCAIYCPVDAIKKSTLSKKVIIDGFNKIDQNFCINCKLCYNICPEDAIIDNGDSLTVNQDKCIYCGACKNICPSNAFIFDRTFVNKNQTIRCSK